jgi:hypothetical protein
MRSRLRGRNNCMLTRRTALVGIAGALVPSIALAHRAHVSLTRIWLNATANTWEIEHELHFHDAEYALRKQAGALRLQLASDEGRARMALYVEERFALHDPRGTALPLRTIGADFERNTLVVFQETAAPRDTGLYRVRNTVLLEHFAEQTNRVHVAVGGDAQTLALSAASLEGDFKLTK